VFFSQIEKLILVLPAEKVEGEMRDMWKRREENSAEMERKWVQEQEVMEAEFKKMADWRAQAEKGLAELEDEKEKWSAKCGDLEAENERLQEMVRTAGEKLELSVARAAEAASSDHPGRTEKGTEAEAAGQDCADAEREANRYLP
jgi:predicted  nucleic acid-binding Zn-ribbon protein